MTISAAERYRNTLKDSTEIVDVTAPSGFVFSFRKPSKFAMLFRHGRMPQTAANGAVASWIEQGVIKAGEIEPAAANAIDELLQLRDRMCDLSVSPKIVAAESSNDDEISTDDIADDDIVYLCRWIAAGGDDSLVLSMFPTEPRSNTLASSSRKKRRATV